MDLSVTLLKYAEQPEDKFLPMYFPMFPSYDRVLQVGKRVS
jgi:hypothetical protein